VRFWVRIQNYFRIFSSQNNFSITISEIIKNLGIILLILEHRNECEFITIFHQVMNSDRYQLNNKYLRKLSMRCKLSAMLSISIWKLVSFMCLIVPSLFMTIAYFDPDMDFSIIVMSIWLMLFIIAFQYSWSIILVISIYTYIISLYIKYRFQQIQDYIEIYLRRGKYILNNFL